MKVQPEFILSLTPPIPFCLKGSVNIKMCGCLYRFLSFHAFFQTKIVKDSSTGEKECDFTTGTTKHNNLQHCGYFWHYIK